MDRARSRDKVEAGNPDAVGRAVLRAELAGALSEFLAFYLRAVLALEAGAPVARHYADAAALVATTVRERRLVAELRGALARLAAVARARRA